MSSLEIDGLDNIDLTQANIEVKTGLDNVDVVYDNSALVDIEPYEYYLTSTGIYSGRLEGGVPAWLAAYVAEQLGSNSAINSNLIISTLQGRLDNAELGISQNLQSIQTTNTSLSALETSVVSRLDGNDAGILDLQTTRVTASEALTIATNLQESTFGNDVDAYITSLTATYASANLAYASDFNTLVSSFNDLDVTLTDTAAVVAGYYSEWDGISTPLLGQFKFVGNVQYQYLGGTLGELSDGWVRTDAAAQATADQAETWAASSSEFITDPNGNITGWQFADGSNVSSEFKISADIFKVGSGSENYVPFTVDTVNHRVQFDGYVEFTNLGINSDSTTIDGGKITTGTLFANSIGTEVIYDSTHWVGGVEQSATTYNMKIDLSNGYIHIK